MSKHVRRSEQRVQRKPFFNCKIFARGFKGNDLQSTFSVIYQNILPRGTGHESSCYKLQHVDDDSHMICYFNHPSVALEHLLHSHKATMRKFCICVLNISYKYIIVYIGLVILSIWGRHNTLGHPPRHKFRILKNFVFWKFRFFKFWSLHKCVKFINLF